MCDVGVKAHIHDVPDGGVIDTHLKGRIVGIDKAVDLRKMKESVSRGLWGGIVTKQ